MSNQRAPLNPAAAWVDDVTMFIWKWNAWRVLGERHPLPRCYHVNLPAEDCRWKEVNKI